MIFWIICHIILSTKCEWGYCQQFTSYKCDDIGVTYKWTPEIRRKLDIPQSTQNCKRGFNCTELPPENIKGKKDDHVCLKQFNESQEFHPNYNRDDHELTKKQTSRLIGKTKSVTHQLKINKGRSWNSSQNIEINNGFKLRGIIVCEDLTKGDKNTIKDNTSSREPFCKNEFKICATPLSVNSEFDVRCSTPSCCMVNNSLDNRSTMTYSLKITSSQFKSEEKGSTQVNICKVIRHGNLKSKLMSKDPVKQESLTTSNYLERNPCYIKDILREVIQFGFINEDKVKKLQLVNDKDKSQQGTMNEDRYQMRNRIGEKIREEIKDTDDDSDKYGNIDEDRDWDRDDKLNDGYRDREKYGDKYWYRDMERDRDRYRDRDRDRYEDVDKDRYTDLDRDRYRYRDKDRDTDRGGDRYTYGNNDRYRDWSRDPERIRFGNRNTDWYRERNRYMDRYFDKEREKDMGKYYDKDGDRYFDKDRDRDMERYFGKDRDREMDRHFDKERDRDMHRYKNRDHYKNKDRNRDKYNDKLQDTFRDDERKKDNAKLEDKEKQIKQELDLRKNQIKNETNKNNGEKISFDRVSIVDDRNCKDVKNINEDNYKNEDKNIKENNYKYNDKHYSKISVEDSEENNTGDRRDEKSLKMHSEFNKPNLDELLTRNLYNELEKVKNENRENPQDKYKVNMTYKVIKTHL